MRSHHMNGHSTFRIREIGDECATIVTSAFPQIQSLPFELVDQGDTLTFSSANPITIQAAGVCTTDVWADDDGHLVQHMSASPTRCTYQPARTG
jgi:hypothetical protein